MYKNLRATSAPVDRDDESSALLSVGRTPKQSSFETQRKSLIAITMVLIITLMVAIGVIFTRVLDKNDGTDVKMSMSEYQALVANSLSDANNEKLKAVIHNEMNQTFHKMLEQQTILNPNPNPGNQQTNWVAATEANLDEITKLAEFQWSEQNKGERAPGAWNKIYHLFANFDANYPCLLGEEVIGKLGKDDGNKWVCGLPYIGYGFGHDSTPDCIIYSMGSSNDFSFEDSLLNKAPHCKIYTFDPFSQSSNKPNDKRLQFFKWGISGENDNKNMKTLPTIVNELKHDHIDIFKIDVEGAEWPAFFKGLESGKWPKMGQILIEIHLWSKWYEKAGFTDNESALKGWFNLLESNGYRLFHKEVNAQYGPECCIEYSFIHKDLKLIIGTKQIAAYFQQAIQTTEKNKQYIIQ